MNSNIIIVYNLFFQISGIISNTGHSVVFTVDNETDVQFGATSPQVPVNLTGGPLSYKYRFQEIHIHYGLHDQFGSEHSVESYTFPAEVSINNVIYQKRKKNTKGKKLCVGHIIFITLYLKYKRNGYDNLLNESAHQPTKKMYKPKKLDYVIYDLSFCM